MRATVHTKDGHQWDEEIEIPDISRLLRVPGVTSVKTSDVRKFVSIEANGDSWLKIQDRMRPILCEDWDPVHVGFVAHEEYDRYMADIYSLIRRNAPAQGIADYLVGVETRIMGQPAVPIESRIKVAEALLALDLPKVCGAWDAA
jgi:hypothetical protein